MPEKKTLLRSAPRNNRVSLVLCGLLAGLLSEGVATRAEAASSELCHTDSACRKRADLATKLYAERRFQEALNEFQAAYEMRADPFLLLNMGRCLFRLGRPRSALAKYEQIKSLNTDLDAETARSLEKYTAEAREALEAEQRESPTAAAPAPAPAVALTAPPPPPPEKQPVYKKWWFWTGIGVVAATAIGVGLGVGLRPKPEPYTDFVWR